MISLITALIGLVRDLFKAAKPVALPPEPKPIDDKVAQEIEAARKRLNGAGR